MKKFCKTLKKHAERIIYWERNKMISLTEEKNKSCENKKRRYICKKRFTKDNKKVRDHCHFTGKYRGAAHNKCSMNYKISRNFPVVSHVGSTYDNHFIIKELIKEFKRKNTKKYITFSVTFNKKIDKNGDEK